MRIPDISYQFRIFRAYCVYVQMRIAITCAKLFNRVFLKKRSPNQDRILLLVFGGLGDCLLFQPLLNRIRDNNPDVRIDIVTGCFEDMWLSLPSVNEVILFGRRSYKSPWAYFRLFWWIYQQGYFQAVEALCMLPQKGAWSIVSACMLEASQASIAIGRQNTGRVPYKVGAKPGFIGNPRKKRGRYISDFPIQRTISPPSPQDRSHNEAYYVAQAMGIEYLRHSGEPYLHFLSNDLQLADLLLTQKHADRPLVGIVVETTYGLKGWPQERFEELVSFDYGKGVDFVLFGLDRIDIEVDNLINLSGRTPLRTMIACIAKCDLFVAADTGPAHVAQATATPTIVLFGPSNEAEFGPRDDMHTLITPPIDLSCRPCVLGPCIRGESCMLTISSQQVASKIRDVIKADDLVEQRQLKTDYLSSHTLPENSYPSVTLQV